MKIHKKMRVKNKMKVIRIKKKMSRNKINLKDFQIN